MTAPQHDMSIEDIDQEIASGSRLLAFKPAIERVFERETFDERVRMAIGSGITAVILYDLFLINDWLTLNDRFMDLVIARLGIFTPAVILIIIFVRHRSTVVRELVSAAAGALAVLLPMVVMIGSESDGRLGYQYGSLLVMIFSSLIQRLRFRYAVVSLTVIVSIQAVTTKMSGIFTPEAFATNVVYFFTAAVLLLTCAYCLERSDRRTFLFIMRGRLLQEELRKLTQVDPLTGLFNRRHLDEAAKEIWAEAGTAPRVVSAVLLDIDHFKAFNDTYGHAQGDDCLRAVSAAVARTAERRSGIAFRYGGEEMVVMLPDIDLSDACTVAEEVRAAIRAEAIPHPVLGEGRVVSASFGVAGVIAPHDDLKMLIEAADTALYAAKKAGRGCVWPARPRQAEDVRIEQAA